MRILIVDDHYRFRESARVLLEAAGHEVVGEAGCGADAVRMAQALGPDLVLLDVQLPDHDGFWVAETLAADDPSAAIVFVSSRDAADYGQRLLDAPAAGFIQKADLSIAALQRVMVEGRT